MGLVAVVAAALAVVLGVPGRRRLPGTGEGSVAERSSAVGRSSEVGRSSVVEPVETLDLGPIRRWRWVWTVLAGLGAAVFLGGLPGAVAGVIAGAGAWFAAGRVEPRGVRRRREAMRRDLPHVVALFGAALRSGAAPGPAITLVCRALPGAAADRLLPVAARLDLGGDPAAVWSEVADEPALGPLGRTMVRTHRTGAPVVAAVDRLAEELAQRARADVEDRARAVGVRAAVPLGVCLLPAFLLLGIVPLVAGLLGEVGVA